MDNIRLGTPWLYDRYLLNVHPWELRLKSDSVVFNECNMWDQVWNVPLHRMSGDVGRKIGQTLRGTIDVVIPGNRSKEERYRRLKVTMNISKPLPKGLNEKTCVQRAKDIRSDTLKNDQFGAWLNAENRVASADYQRHKIVHSTEGHNLMKNKNSKLIEGKRDVRTGKILIHIQEGVDLTNTHIVPFLKETMRLYSPSMIFFSETKNRESTVKRVQRQVNMVHAVTVEPMGLSGGLALFWNDTIQLVTLMILLMDRKNKEEEVEILGPLETFRILYGGAIDLGHKGKARSCLSLS
ncbi:hypothetical protein KY284_014396 [Solanum tuberosum]|nr:hypothetical protein KY284_014396 [Solanum tuberosum]